MEKLLETGAWSTQTQWVEFYWPCIPGKVKSLGVSNFSIKTLTELLPHCTIIPAVNQVELHPCLPQHDLRDFCDHKGILLTAYSSLGDESTHSGLSYINIGPRSKFYCALWGCDDQTHRRRSQGDSGSNSPKLVSAEGHRCSAKNSKRGENSIQHYGKLKDPLYAFKLNLMVFQISWLQSQKRTCAQLTIYIDSPECTSPSYGLRKSTKSLVGNMNGWGGILARVVQFYRNSG